MYIYGKKCVYILFTIKRKIAHRNRACYRCGEPKQKKTNIKSQFENATGYN